MEEKPIIVGRHEGHDTLLKLYPEDRARHFYCLGKTGTGKSTLALNMLMQDILLGHGAALIDPHGAAAEDVLKHFPRWRARDLLYLNPADPTYSIGLNPLDVPESQRTLAASQVVSILKARWADSCGPSLEEVLGNSVSALMYTPGATFLGIERLLCDRDYRKRVVSRVADPAVRFFWQMRFGTWSSSVRETKIEPVLNKVGQFLRVPSTRHLFAQSRSTFDLRFMMDNRRVLIANLSSGAIGEDNSSLIGAFLISKIYLTALGRARVIEEALAASQEELVNDLESYPNFYLYVDEFQNFATSSFEAILSQARKFKLPITLANQYLEQLSPEIQKAVFGNVGSLAVFRVSRSDAERLAPELDCESAVVPGHLTGLPSRQAYVKLLIDGEETQACRMRTFPPYESGCKDRRGMLITRSRARFGRERAQVEEKLTRWLAAGEKRSIKAAATKPQPRNEGQRGVPKTTPEATPAQCPYCDSRARLFLRTEAGTVVALPCPHDGLRLEALCKERGLRRM